MYPLCTIKESKYSSLGFLTILIAACSLVAPSKEISSAWCICKVVSVPSVGADVCRNICWVFSCTAVVTCMPAEEEFAAAAWAAAMAAWATACCIAAEAEVSIHVMACCSALVGSCISWLVWPELSWIACCKEINLFLYCCVYLVGL